MEITSVGFGLSLFVTELNHILYEKSGYFSMLTCFWAEWLAIAGFHGKTKGRGDVFWSSFVTFFNHIFGGVFVGWFEARCEYLSSFENDAGCLGGDCCC